MARQMGNDELEGLESTFKNYHRVATETTDPAQRDRCQAKAEYWRRVAELVDARVRRAKRRRTTKR